MANTASAKKQARESQKRALRNRSVKSAVKTHVVRVRRAVSGGDEIGELVTTAVSSLDRAAAKGILHRNNAARRKSRLMKLAAVQGAPAEARAAAPTRQQSSKAGRGRGKKA